MGLLYKDDLLDSFGSWPLGYIPYGGPDFGEVAAVAKAVGEGGADAYHAAWIVAGDRLSAQAEAAEASGRLASARELYLRAAVFYADSYHPLYGAPVDPRLTAAFRKQAAALDRGLSLLDPPVRPQTIPFEGAGMPAYFLPAAGLAGRPRPTPGNSPSARMYRSRSNGPRPPWPRGKAHSSGAPLSMALRAAVRATRSRTRRRSGTGTEPRKSQPRGVALSASRSKAPSAASTRVIGAIPSVGGSG